MRASGAEHRRRSPKHVAFVATAAVVFASALWFGSRSSWFDVRTFEVRGVSHLSDDDVVRLADVAAGTSTVWLDEAELERRIEADPWVAAATVGASWPHTVDIEVRERRPIAVAVDASSRTLIAADGTALGAADAARGLPEISLAGVEPDDVAALASGAARAVDALSPAVARTVERVTARPDGSLELHLEDGILVRYGAPTGERLKAVSLAEVLRWARRDGNAVARVSLAAPGTPAVAFAA